MDKSIGQERSADASGRGPGSRPTREKLMGAAAELIAEVGWGRVTTRSVAERAGVPHGAVSYHFHGKQELLIEACLFAFSEALSPEAFSSLASVDDLITLVGQEVESAAGTTSALSGLMFEAMREAGRDEALRERLRDLMREYRALVVDLVRAEQERGALPADASPVGLATFFSALGDGLLLHVLLDRDLDVTDVTGALRALLTSSRPPA